MGSNVISVGIAISAAQSAPVSLDNQEIVAIQMPAAWSASAVLTFLTSADNVTYQPLYTNGGVEASCTVVPATNMGLSDYLLDIAPWPYIKLRSGTAAAEVAQTAARTFKLVVK